jgi:hypothetical protein
MSWSTRSRRPVRKTKCTDLKAYRRREDCAGRVARPKFIPSILEQQRGVCTFTRTQFRRT